MIWKITIEVLYEAGDITYAQPVLKSYVDTLVNIHDAQIIAVKIAPETNK